MTPEQIFKAREIARLRAVISEASRDLRNESGWIDTYDVLRDLDAALKGEE